MACDNSCYSGRASPSLVKLDVATLPANPFHLPEKSRMP